MPAKKKTASAVELKNVTARVEAAKTVWLHSGKKLLLIRPVKSGDDYTALGSHKWAEALKTKAQSLGWSVTDLSGNNATRQKIEDAIKNVKPRLILHYDHGNALTMHGQQNDAFVAGLDEQNIDKASGRLVSTVSCNSAKSVGLGGTSIQEGVTSYLGYKDLHSFGTYYSQQFGEAANAANVALLKGRTMKQAYITGWYAYHKLYLDLVAQGGLVEELIAPLALADRDGLTLLGSESATAAPDVFHCVAGPDVVYHCVTGMPDSLIQRCVAGNPDVHCAPGHPDMGFGPLCATGHPDMESLCGVGPELGFSCAVGLPNGPQCAPGHPVITVFQCGVGPNLGLSCAAGPPLRVRDVIEDYPYDLLIVDLDKIPRGMKKAFRSMVRKMAGKDR